MSGEPIAPAPWYLRALWWLAVLTAAVILACLAVLSIVATFNVAADAAPKCLDPTSVTSYHAQWTGDQATVTPRGPLCSDGIVSLAMFHYRNGADGPARVDQSLPQELVRSDVATIPAGSLTPVVLGPLAAPSCFWQEDVMVGYPPDQQTARGLPLIDQLARHGGTTMCVPPTTTTTTPPTTTTTAPPVTTTTVPSLTTASVPASRATLPVTGSSDGPAALGALGLLGAGAALVVVARRRHRMA